MKKIFEKGITFILFSTILLSLSFIPTPAVLAAESKGTCVVYGSNPDIPTIDETKHITYEECQAKVHGNDTFGWTPDSAPGVSATSSNSQTKVGDSDDPSFWAEIFRNLIATIGTIFLQITGLFVGLAGAILNGVIYYTIYKVADNYSNLAPILETWKVLRDLANMSFIFVLLYAGIKTMLGQGGSDTKKVITGVVVAAVLLNFSIFFTRLVIDAANVLALTFYNAVAPNTTTSGFLTWGLSNAFMQHLNLQSLYQLSNTTTISWDTILSVGVMGSIMLLVAAFVFLAIALFFIIRYVVLLLVIVLSPIYFVSFALPKDAGMEGYAKKWEAALVNQAFFAPVFFLLIWVSLRLMDGIFDALNGGAGGGDLTAGGFGGIAVASTPSAGTLITILNFVIVITLLLTSLTTAKKMADQAGGGMSNLTKWATGKAGSVTFGAAGALGRGTIGRAGQAFGDSEMLKKAQEWSNKRGGAVGATAGFTTRKFMEAGRGIGGATFDARGAGLGGKDAGKVTNKGGYAGYVKKAAEDEEKFAKSLAPSDVAKAKARRILADAEKKYGKNSFEAREAQRKIDLLEGAKEDDLRKREREQIAKDELVKRSEKLKKAAADAEKNLASNDPILKKEKEVADQIKKKEQEINSTVIPELKTQRMEELETMKKQLEEAKKAAEVRRAEIAEQIETSKSMAASVEKAADERIKTIKGEYDANGYERDEDGNLKAVRGVGDERKKNFADSVEKSAWGKLRGYNVAAAAKIRQGKKPIKDQIKEMLDEDKPKEEGKPKEGAEGEEGKGDKKEEK
jgi:hypothetical protein